MQDVRQSSLKILVIVKGVNYTVGPPDPGDGLRGATRRACAAHDKVRKANTRPGNGNSEVLSALDECVTWLRRTRKRRLSQWSAARGIPKLKSTCIYADKLDISGASHRASEGRLRYPPRPGPSAGHSGVSARSTRPVPIVCGLPGLVIHPRTSGPAVPWRWLAPGNGQIETCACRTVNQRRVHSPSRLEPG